MRQKPASVGDFKELLRHLDTLKRNTEGIWGQAVLAKERILLAHHRLKSDPRLLPQMFTKEERYQHGRALIASQDQKAVLSREEADLAFYHKLMSNKFKDGSLSDRKKPQLFLTREVLSSHNVKRVIAKYCREFGSQPIGLQKRMSVKAKLMEYEKIEKGEIKDNHWRKDVNDFVLGRYGKIYSPKHSKHADLTQTMPSLASVRSAPCSPSPIPMSTKRVTFSTLSNYSVRSGPRKETEALNIKLEIKRAKRQSVDERLKLGIGNLKSMDSLKLKSGSKPH